MFNPHALRAAALVVFTPAFIQAHCDTWDGPVVTAAQKALALNDVRLVLPWVRSQDEAPVRAAFARALEVRRLGGEAQKLADQFFFETLVRLHRAGEGATYTGLKPAGGDPGPAISAAEKALETGDLKPLWNDLREGAHGSLHARFEAVQKAKAYAAGDVEAGRRYVAAFVAFMHHVEALHAASRGAAADGSGGQTCGAE